MISCYAQMTVAAARAGGHDACTTRRRWRRVEGRLSVQRGLPWPSRHHPRPTSRASCSVARRCGASARPSSSPARPPDPARHAPHDGVGRRRPGGRPGLGSLRIGADRVAGRFLLDDGQGAYGAAGRCRARSWRSWSSAATSSTRPDIARVAAGIARGPAQRRDGARRHPAPSRPVQKAHELDLRQTENMPHASRPPSTSRSPPARCGPRPAGQARGRRRRCSTRLHQPPGARPGPRRSDQTLLDVANAEAQESRGRREPGAQARRAGRREREKQAEIDTLQAEHRGCGPSSPRLGGEGADRRRIEDVRVGRGDVVSPGTVIATIGQMATAASRSLAVFDNDMAKRVRPAWTSM